MTIATKRPNPDQSQIRCDPKPGTREATICKLPSPQMYRLPKTMNDTVNQAMSVFITSMRALKEQLKVLNKAIKQQFAIIPNTLVSVSGIGKVYCAGMLLSAGGCQLREKMRLRVPALL